MANPYKEFPKEPDREIYRQVLLGVKTEYFYGDLYNEAMRKHLEKLEEWEQGCIPFKDQEEAWDKFDLEVGCNRSASEFDGIYPLSEPVEVKTWFDTSLHEHLVLSSPPSVKEEPVKPLTIKEVFEKIPKETIEKWQTPYKPTTQPEESQVQIMKDFYMQCVDENGLDVDKALSSFTITRKDNAPSPRQ